MVEPKHSWPDTDIRILRDRWEKGYASRDIAKLLGVSKNSVIGKAHRLGLSPHVDGVGRRPTNPKAPIPKPTKELVKRSAPQPTLDSCPTVPGASLSIPILNIKRGQCRWIDGEHSTARYCGQPVARGRYCIAHARLVYQAPKPRRDTNAA